MYVCVMFLCTNESKQVPLVSRQTLLNNKVDLRANDFVVSQVMTSEAAAPQRGTWLG